MARLNNSPLNRRSGFPAIRFYAFALVAACSAGAAVAQVEAHAAAAAPSAMEVKSAILVERSETAKDGKVTTSLKDPKSITVVPGDKLVITLNWANKGGEAATNFVAVNPVHTAVRFDDVREDWAEVSIDGGKNWVAMSALPTLKVSEDTTGEDGTVASISREAGTGDVTHVRWNFKDPIAAGKSGSLEFRGTVK